MKTPVLSVLFAMFAMLSGCDVSPLDTEFTAAGDLDPYSEVVPMLWECSGKCSKTNATHQYTSCAKSDSEAQQDALQFCPQQAVTVNCTRTSTRC